MDKQNVIVALIIITAITLTCFSVYNTLTVEDSYEFGDFTISKENYHNLMSIVDDSQPVSICDIVENKCMIFIKTDLNKDGE